MQGRGVSIWTRHIGGGTMYINNILYLYTRNLAMANEVTSFFTSIFYIEVIYLSRYFCFILKELYSQNYKEVGIMFASISNFSDFYSEDAINNQGTECLRVLNEIFSDFDQVSDQER